MIKLAFIYNGDFIGNSEELETTENDVYKAIGIKLAELADQLPGVLEVDTGAYGYASFNLTKRGEFIKDGIKHPSMYVTETYNDISRLEPSSYEPAYLTCINPESNSYKFYHLKPSSKGIDATYGRIGSARGEAFGVRDLAVPYPTHMYWIRYYEKLSKGYVDQTKIYLGQQATTKELPVKQPETPSEELYSILLKYARHVVKSTLINENITPKQVKEARKIYTELCKKVQLKAFNRWLMKLLVLSPRKIDAGRRQTVNDFLASSKEDFKDIILREESLLNAMEAVVYGIPEKSTEESFAMFGIDVYEATDEQRAKVTEKLSDQLKPLVKKVYRVIPREQKKRFDNYLKTHKIRKVKELWHGSRNENWLSIIANSLKLNPNAQITGKMFGEGIYFAPSSMKSWGYTSYYGTHWAGGNQGTAFMGIFATAYGKPYMVSSYGQWIDQKTLDGMGYNCLHAEPARTGLRNDEIVFYDEDAVCLNYIVQFA